VDKYTRAIGSTLRVVSRVQTTTSRRVDAPREVLPGPSTRASRRGKIDLVVRTQLDRCGADVHCRGHEWRVRRLESHDRGVERTPARAVIVLVFAAKRNVERCYVTRLARHPVV
jgi:hypothetical protein